MSDLIAKCPECGWTGGPYKAAFYVRRELAHHSCEKHRRKLAAAENGRRIRESIDRTPKQNTRYPHGTPACHRHDGCRCWPCAKANTAAQRNRARAHAYGRFHLVDAEPARRHVRELMAAGIGIKRIAQLSGVNETTVARLLYGQPRKHMRGMDPGVSSPRPPTRRIAREAEALILNVPIDFDLLRPGRMVPAVGSARRLQALVALGWTQAHLIDVTGISEPALRKITNERRKYVQAWVHRRIADVFEDLSTRLPPVGTQSIRAKGDAVKRGWAPPAAWDNIDDPDAKPMGMHRGYDIVEEIERLLDALPYTSAQIAQAFGHKSRKTITQACNRAGRHDLVERMAANALRARRAAA